jgi:hypothetical protein
MQSCALPWHGATWLNTIASRAALATIFRLETRGRQLVAFLA